jgi:exopolysaccharide biosynthesis polyprenyl glycosylphosphotransferase
MRNGTVTRSTGVFDLLLLTGAFALTTLVHIDATGAVSFAQFLGLRVRLSDVLIFLTLLGFWNFNFAVLGLYRSKRMATITGEAFDCVKATTLCALVLAAASFLLHFQWVTPSFILVFWGISTGLVVLSRLVVRTVLRRLRVHGRDSRNMLIIGSNPRAMEFATQVQSKPELGYRIIGFADQEWSGSGEMERQGWSRVCTFDELRTFIRRSVVDEVVLTVPLRSFHDLASSVVATCELQGIAVRMLPDLFELKHRNRAAEEVLAAPVIAHSAVSEGWATRVKRVLDFTLSLLLIIFCSPVLVMAAILIKLTSPGPILFVQKRVGLNKRVFNIYKFRTMVVNAEQKLQEIEHLNEVSGPVFKIKNDPRITPVGKFLRSSSIDELPQLFNVLKGDMSLVGPRPLQLRDYELFTENCEDWQRCRFSVRPGITCLWQVKGRSALPFQEWMELDLLYVRTWSLWLDLQILAKTVPAVLRGSGAA